MTEDEYLHVRRFLSNFGRIYTVNYDLLMYWARNQEELEPREWSTDDGFRANQRWLGPGTDQQVFFLHGALHLYQDESGVKKRAFAKAGNAIIDVVQQALRRNVFPLFVFEPTSALKLERINSNPYLSYCLRRLSQESGGLLVFGHQLSEVDAHIVTAIDASHVDQVFISLLGNEQSVENRRIKATSLAYLQQRGRSVEFVDASTIPVWRAV